MQNLRLSSRQTTFIEIIGRLLLAVQYMQAVHALPFFCHQHNLVNLACLPLPYTLSIARSHSYVVHMNICHLIDRPSFWGIPWRHFKDCSSKTRQAAEFPSNYR